MEKSEVADKCRAEIEVLTLRVNTLERQLELSRRAEAVANDEIDRLKFRSKSLDNQLDNCLRATEINKAALYDEMIATLAQIGLERSVCREKLTECEAACRALDAQLTGVYASLSWQVTKPLRFLRRVISRLAGSKR